MMPTTTYRYLRRHGQGAQGAPPEWQGVSATFFVNAPDYIEILATYSGGQPIDDVIIDRRVDGGAWDEGWNTTTNPVSLQDNTINSGSTYEYRLTGRIAETPVTDSVITDPVIVP
jgi:hypothetical protein